MASATHAHVPFELPAVCDSPPRSHFGGGAAAQRPFTASGARQSQLLAVHVHFGEHIVATDSQKAGDLLRSYVALRVIKSISSGHVPMPNAGDEDDDHELYHLMSTPFATSRVVEHHSSPLWNELLLVSLPIEWKTQSDSERWTLVVDVVCKDESQQEDVLLASATLRLVKMDWSSGPHHIALPFEQGANQTRIYLSLYEATHMECDRVLEFAVQEIAASSTSPLTDLARGIFCVLTTAPPQPIVHTKDFFRLFSSPEDVGSSTHHGEKVWISPVGWFKPSEAGSQSARLRYPELILHSTPIETIYVQVLCVSSGDENASGPLSIVTSATASVNLLTVSDDGAKTDLLAELEMKQIGASTTRVAMNVCVRLWNELSWREFAESSGIRRVITTNRRHRRESELYSLDWTGAICRGFNRYPVSSLCDEGGLSGILVQCLAIANVRVETSEVGHGAGEPVSEQLLHQHIRLLQQEVMAKQNVVQQLRQESDSRHTALQACGAELVAARQELRVRSGIIADLRAKISALEQRDHDQVQRLLETPGGSSGLLNDNQTALRMNQLIAKYKDLEKQHEASKKDLSDAKRRLLVLEQLERKYAELEHAHMTQAALVQRLQQEKTQSAELQRTIRMQERVIRKLEKAMSSHQSVVESEDLVKVELEDGKHNGRSHLVAVRVEVLEQQLRDNAREAANEISQLRMRVLELEAQISTVDNEHYRQ